MISMIHLSLTLYNSWKEVDWVDFLLSVTDIGIVIHATIFMLWWVRISETFAVLILVCGFWIMSLLRHSKQERKLRRRNEKIIRRARELDERARDQIRNREHSGHDEDKERKYYENAWSSSS